MFFQRLSIAAVVALSFLLAPLAHAQGTGGTSGGSTSAGSIRVTLISIGTRQVNSIGQIYMNAEECTDNATLLFKVDFAPKDKTTIDIYSGENCNSTDRMSTTVNRCIYLPDASKTTGGVTMGLMLRIKAQELVADCSLQQESKPKLWFLAVSALKSTEDVGNRYGLFDRLEVDTTPPSPPISVSSSEGEHVIPVTWTGGQTNLKGFTVYIDPNPGAAIGGAPPTTNDTSGAGNTGSTGSGGSSDIDGGLDAGLGLVSDAGIDTEGTLSDGGVALGVPNPSCPSVYLLAGTPAGKLPDGLRVKHVNEPTGTGVDLSPEDIGSMHAAVSVVSVDLAGNESVLSNVACLDVVKTTSFWDRYLENGGEPKSGCACSTVGAAQLESAWPVALALLGLSLTAQRRRKS